MAQLNGQIYVVTGASKGIGRSVSMELAKAGATVVLLARESEELAQALADVQLHAGASFAVACDLGVSTDIEGAANTVLTRATVWTVWFTTQATFTPSSPCSNPRRPTGHAP